MEEAPRKREGGVGLLTKKVPVPRWPEQVPTKRAKFAKEFYAARD